MLPVPGRGLASASDRTVMLLSIKRNDVDSVVQSKLLSVSQLVEVTDDKLSERVLDNQLGYMYNKNCCRLGKNYDVYGNVYFTTQTTCTIS